MIAVLAGVAAGTAAWLAVPSPTRWPSGPGRAPSGVGHRARRRHLVQAVLAGVAGALFVGGPAGPPVGVVVAAVTWRISARAEPARVRREREQVRRDLPHLVHLLGSGVRAGAAPGDAVRLACAALPGPAAARLRPVAEQLSLGADPGRVWESLAGDPELAALGRCLARAHETGAPVVAAVDRLADELRALGRSQVEQRARTVGVRAALPLGLCLLPAFLLLGIVPLVAGLLTGITQ